MRLRAAAGLFLAFAVSGAAKAGPEVDALFATYSPATPGCAVGIKAQGEAARYSVYGAADLEHAAPITPATVFEAGSVSKQFTAAAILLLAQDGKLSLSDDIRKYLPEMPDYGAPITIDMLLSHTSGLRDWGEVMALAGWPRTSRVYTAAEILEVSARQKTLNYPPGDAYSYTNTGFNLAGWIVKRVTGKTLAAFTAERIFRPLGMSATRWRDDFNEIIPGRAIAYMPAAGAAGFRQQMPFENTYGHGGLLTTVGDLLIWNEALTSGALGSDLDTRLREQPRLTGGRRIAYARGLVVQSHYGHTEVAHAGATAAYRAWLGRYPAAGLSVALLCNRGDVNPVAVGRGVAETLLPPPPPSKGSVRKAPSADLARLPGLYVDERAGGLLRVADDGGRLRIAGGPALTPNAPNRYVGGDAAYEFGEAGVTRRAADDETTAYRRVTPVSPSEGELAPLAGTYASSEAGGAWIADVREGRLVLTPQGRPSAAMTALPLYADAFQAGGDLLRIVRNSEGAAVGLRFTGSRVYSLVFDRVQE